MNRRRAEAVLDACLTAGAREFCVCAGSRNSPLVLPLLRTSGIDVFHFYDERAAAFFALGRLMARKRPVVVVTTSGTAAAELLPAVIEAHYQKLPMILLTADRPKAFRGSGAPQSIEQAGLFGGYVEMSLDVDAPRGAEALSMKSWGRTGPAHLNVCFDEPLLATGDDEAGDLAVPAYDPPSARTVGVDFSPLRDFLAGKGDLVILLGGLREEERNPVAELLSRLEAPVWAEATSGLREDPRLAGSLLKGGEGALKTFTHGRVLRIGGVPSLRFWRDLEDRLEVDVLSITRAGFPGLARPSRVLECGDRIAGIADAGDSIQVASAPEIHAEDGRQAGRLEDALRRRPLSEPALVRWLSTRIPGGATVFLGNSLPIREWNLAATRKDRGFQCFASRGANGIDGQVSTFLGVAADAREAWAVLGDLTTLYDLGAPWICPQLRGGPRRIVILNNGGGRIFSRLPVLGDLPAHEKSRFENRHALGFAAWAEMWDWEYVKAEAPEEMELPERDTIVEVCPDEGETDGFWAAWAQG